MSFNSAFPAPNTNESNALRFYPNGVVDSTSTLVSPQTPSRYSAHAQRIVDYDASFGHLASVYGYGGGVLPGPPPVNPSKGSKKAKTSSRANEDDTAFGKVASVYGAEGAFPAPVDSLPRKKWIGKKPSPPTFSPSDSSDSFSHASASTPTRPPDSFRHIHDRVRLRRAGHL